MKLYRIMLIGFCATAGCMYGYSSSTDIAMRDSYSYKPHSRNVEIFFDDEKPAVPYRQIAMIEIDGAARHSNNDILMKMRKRAQELGADAVIGIKKSLKTRTQGSLVADILVNDPDDADTYQASVLIGIAVKYLEEELP